MSFKRITLLTALLGVAIFIAGFMYDVVIAGIPYQDPTLEMQQRYNFHSSVASWIRLIGGVALLLSPLVGKVLHQSKNTTS